MPVVKQDNEADHFTMRVDESGKISFIDQRVVELLDQRVEDVLNKSLWQCFHQADEPLIKEAFRQIMANAGDQQNGVKVKLICLKKSILFSILDKLPLEQTRWNCCLFIGRLQIFEPLFRTI